ncbi:helix-turn-helix transcriptional regulator, partial [Staphylococcus nepalensis]|uniref:helix-turn-helix transcriptional regulator n=1 Tax=Staphylococcus nepalensis TaxID=214473 RepID=UPI000CD37C77
MKKSERLNQELIFLSNKSTFHLKDIMQAFSISKRTALRDIQELEALGLALYVENGRYGGYKLISQNLLTPIYFNNNEILAIFFALKALDILSNTPFEKSYEQIKEKLFASLPNEKQQDIAKVLKYIHYYNVAPINSADNLERILTSIMDEERVYITYTPVSYTHLTL